ncbi:hypothetical protein [Rhodovulum sp. PH10]|uniref:hypothetical protein n=1 Tax=Rhodovulum sp. PH10 TaxID=1187851 RepID=UPI00058BB394|nr:hypothetical protein [Rhodovulum sp. PH10]
MRFDNPSLQDGLLEWRKLPGTKERSEADNLWFEDRVSTKRRLAFEQEAHEASNQSELRRAQADYWSEFVRVDEGVPHTFAAQLEPADLGPIDETQKIVRLESLTRPLNDHGISFGDLLRAHAKGEHGVIDAFLAVWNTAGVRDGRPAFGAFEDEVIDDLKSDEWPRRLRDRLGLAHYDCRYGPIPVALMEYTVAEVRAAAAKASVACAFTAPRFSTAARGRISSQHHRSFPAGARWPSTRFRTTRNC